MLAGSFACKSGHSNSLLKLTARLCYITTMSPPRIKDQSSLTSTCHTLKLMLNSTQSYMMTWIYYTNNNLLDMYNSYWNLHSNLLTNSQHIQVMHFEIGDLGKTMPESTCISSNETPCIPKFDRKMGFESTCIQLIHFRPFLH